MNKHPSASEAWINNARAVPVECELERRGIKLRGNIERVGPCPKCGGEDRFGISTAKQVFNCRGCDVGGDVIKLVQHLDAVDFITACTILAGDPPTTGVTRAAKVLAAEYRYEDEGGDLVFMVKRFEYRRPDGTYVTKDGKRKKTFSQCRPDLAKPGTWIWNLEGVAPLLYRLPEVMEAVANDRVIVVVEGERKVDLLNSWNVPATCNAGIALSPPSPSSGMRTPIS
jgi:hypothetical protein